MHLFFINQGLPDLNAQTVRGKIALAFFRIIPPEALVKSHPQRPKVAFVHFLFK
jgi:hypothetical protein